ncbi:MAG: hypothetical protein JW871_07595 [Endomicrobiales bacterium]|nr:hypothetical protein [Endomicrobiales bacterium]
MRKLFVSFLLFLTCSVCVYSEPKDLLDFEVKETDLKKSVVAEARKNVVISLNWVKKTRSMYQRWLKRQERLKTEMIDEDDQPLSNNYIEQENILLEDWAKSVHQFQKDVDFYLKTKKQLVKPVKKTTPKRRTTTKKKTTPATKKSTTNKTTTKPTLRKTTTPIKK